MWSESKIQRVLDEARTGDNESQYLIACYFFGTGDLASAFEWFRSSAENEHPLAKHVVTRYFRREAYLSQFDDANTSFVLPVDRRGT